MRDVAAQRPVTELLLVLAEGASSHPVGDHDTIDRQKQAIVTSGPYSILWSIPVGAFDGSFGQPTEEAVFRYQLDAYNYGRDGVEWLADLNRKALSSWPFDADGWRIMHIEITPGAPVSQGRDERNDLPLFVVSDDLAVHVVPA